MIHTLPGVTPGSAARALLTAAVLVLAVACAEPPAASEPQTAQPKPLDLDSDDAKASYFVGYGVSDDWRQRLGDRFDAAAFEAGITDALGEVMPKVSQEEGGQIMQSLAQAAQEQARKVAEEELEKGRAFLVENATKDGIQVTDSGLQYEVLEAGDGPKPGPTDTVTTHYEGRLIDGTVFDSSIERGQPAQFPLNRVIPGWTEALQLMSTGAKYRLYIPSELAYGQRPQGSIPPNSTLIFDVELISIDSAGGDGGGA
ncbi:MAG: FKBP-type peptidyl-prolyl cis-trans isomerase [Pseudomonadota bacterium]